MSGMRQGLRGSTAAFALSNVRTMEERIVLATAAPRLLMAVLTTFAVLTGCWPRSVCTGCWPGRSTNGAASSPSALRSGRNPPRWQGS